MKRRAILLSALAIPALAYAGLSHLAPRPLTGRCEVPAEQTTYNLFACPGGDAANEAPPEKGCDILVLVNGGPGDVGLRLDTAAMVEIPLMFTVPSLSAWSSDGLHTGPTRSALIDTRAARGWGTSFIYWQCVPRT